jgi:hypothetical protein
MTTKTKAEKKTTTPTRKFIKQEIAASEARAKAAPKPEPKKKAAPKDDSTSELVKGDRDRLLKMAKDGGLKVEEKSAWFKLTGNDKKARIYVARKGPQVHFTFPVKNTEQVSEAEAKKRHIGSVRSILWLDRQKSDVLKDIFAEALKQVR